ncbi:MAG: helix-turn-helix domain-containing protein [Oscillospiraceae bacterium]
MEFHEKLQELRKQKGLTQEELAELLFVSRTAISKWESGRGYPNIDSLKAISQYFSVSVDELLSGDAILSLSEEESRQKENRSRSLVFGSLDCSTAIFLFLPFFGQRAGSVIQGVSLLSLTEIEPYIKIPYLIVVFAMVIWGMLLLALQNSKAAFWLQRKDKVSLGLSAAAALLFMISLQPYAATFTFVFLVIKALLLIKWA